MPTIIQLAGAKMPNPTADQLDGTSLVPVFHDPSLEELPPSATNGLATANKTFAYSQYPHTTDYSCPWFRGGGCHASPSQAHLTPHGRRLLEQGLLLPPPVDGSFMGFSVRDRKFRYTAWLPWSGGRADWTVEPYRELYDHSADTGADFDAMDVVNVAYVPAFQSVVDAMQNQAVLFFHHLMPPTGGGGGGNETKLTKKECDAAGGILGDHKAVCCARSCGTCGGKGCAAAPGGKYKCCGSEIKASGRLCSVVKAPCHG